MKETRFFYVPDIASTGQLPPEESQHAVRVLRMVAGDEMVLMDGKGTFYQAEIAVASPHGCMFNVLQVMPQQPSWQGHLHIAMAPTKAIDRTEWAIEKAVEIGIDELSLLNCKNSERHDVKVQRLDKIVVSAMKQSRKAWKPRLNEMDTFGHFASRQVNGRKYVAHCHEDIPRTYLFDELRKPCGTHDTTVLVGPEGDFTLDEVRMAIDEGYVSVHLGDSRLRTETATIVVAMMLHLA